MKKSIAFLGALLFGSVTFGQVTKNDSIKKPSSRKVSADDMKKFPADTETEATDGHIKIESSQKHIKYKSSGKYTSDNDTGLSSKIKGGVTQKGKVVESTNATEKHPAETSAKNGEIALEKVPGRDKKNTNNKHITTEKQHYTVKLTNANKKANPDATEQTDNGNGEATTQKKHVSNIKWSGDKVKNDSVPTPTSKTSGNFLKIGDIKGEKDDK